MKVLELGFVLVIIWLRIEFRSIGKRLLFLLICDRTRTLSIKIKSYFLIYKLFKLSFNRL